MSRLPFELLLALRYLRPKRTVVSIITLISIIGVMLGVAVLIIVISVMTGFDHDLREKVFGFTAHMKVYDPERTIGNYAEIGAVIASNRNVRGVAPFVISRVMLRTEPAAGQSMVDAPLLRGTSPEAEAKVTSLVTNVVAGKFDLQNRGLLIGYVLANRLRLHLGDRVAIYSPAQLQKMEESYRLHKEVVPVARDFEIRGIFDTGYDEFDSGHVVASLEDAQELYNLLDDDNVQGLLIALHDPFKAGQTAADLRAKLGKNLEVSTWMEDNPLMMAVLVEKNVMLYILFFIVVVAAFGITCTLITFIMMKTREIGLLKALGASPRQVMLVFLSQSLIVSILGVIAGVSMGLLAIAYRNEFLDFMRRATGFELFPSSVYGFSKLPALIMPGDVLIICGGSMIICLIAAAVPAWHASKLHPVEALRHE